MIITRVNSEGEIREMFYPGSNIEVDEGPTNDGTGDTIVFITDTVSNLATYSRTKYYIDGAWKDRSAAPGEYYLWADEGWHKDENRLYFEIRQERNNRLQYCDWTQAADSPLSDSKKTEWGTYRQSLRDVPANNLNKNHFDDVVWPTAPS